MWRYHGRAATPYRRFPISGTTSSFRLASLPRHTKRPRPTIPDSKPEKTASRPFDQPSVAGEDNEHMKSGILLAVLLACTTCSWSAQKYSASGLVLKVDRSDRKS